ncbi:MAG TPA: hypothetical protein VI485_18615 [Vicinamibacterales bacterium]|nr:hypothetical protein [Vicinamibacterales bacterium]
MTGSWIAAIAQRLLRDDTFARVLEPAVADLQFEAPRQTRLRRLASYAAVLLVLVRAVFHDLRGDLALAFGGDALRRAWTPAIICYVSLFVILLWRQLSTGIVVHFYGTVTHLPLPPAGDGLEPYVAGLAVRVGLVCVSYAMVTAVFTFRRQRIGTARTALAAVLLIAVTTSAVARLSRPARESKDLIGAAMVMREDGDSPRARRLADVVASQVIPKRLGMPATFREYIAKVRAWEEIRIGLDVLAFALAGAALSKARGWRLGARAAAMIATGYVFSRWAVPIVDLIIVPLGNRDPALQALPGFLVIPFVACVFLAIGPRTRRAA